MQIPGKMGQETHTRHTNGGRQGALGQGQLQAGRTVFSFRCPRQQPGVPGTPVWIVARVCSKGIPSPPLGLGHPQTHLVAPEEITASGSLAENKLDCVYGEDVY